MIDLSANTVAIIEAVHDALRPIERKFGIKINVGPPRSGINQFKAELFVVAIDETKGEVK